MTLTPQDELVTGDEYRNREIKELNAPIRGISGTFQCIIARVVDQGMWLEAVNEVSDQPWVVQKKVPVFHGHEPLKVIRITFTKCEKFISAESDWAKTFYMPSP